jgi:carbon-monoxide dehydrogenase medium subunit
LKAPAFAYVKASSLPEVFELLERHGGDAKILAGGQSLVPALNMRLSSPSVLIDINGVSALRGGIVVDGERLRIGGLTRHCELAASEEIAWHAPLIAQAMPHVAHAAIRTRGTFGGSIAFADPAAELPACALALGAEFVLASHAGERRVAARDFFTSLYTTAMRSDEVLVAAEFPLKKGPRRSAFLELSRRRGDYAIVGIAIDAEYGAGKFADASIVFFGVGATPLLAPAVAAALEGRALGDELIAAAQAAVSKDVAPADGLYESAATKLHLAKVLLGRALAKLGTDAARQDMGSGRSSFDRLRTTGGGAGARVPSSAANPQHVVDVAMTVNGSRVAARVPARQHLVDFLREDLGLIGAHLGCEHGVCGACTVIVDGEIVRGCLMLAAQADGAAVETIEGLAGSGRLAALQRAFHERNAAQCGFCSPAMLITAADLIERKAGATREEIREHISGNYCRCTGYQAIVDAIESVLSLPIGVATSSSSRQRYIPDQIAERFRSGTGIQAPLNHGSGFPPARE